MKHVTYAELLALLKTMTPDQLAEPVTVRDNQVDELYPVHQLFQTNAHEDRLDIGHTVLGFNGL